MKVLSSLLVSSLLNRGSAFVVSHPEHLTEKPTALHCKEEVNSLPGVAPPFSASSQQESMVKKAMVKEVQ